MKSKVILVVLLAAILTLTACGRGNEDSNKETPPAEQEIEKAEELKEPIKVDKVEVEDERLSLLQDYLTMLYYRNDAYDDYVALYADPEDAVGEDTFDSFRQGSSLENSFGTEDIGTIMETMKVEETGETEATVNFYGIVHIDKFVEIYNLQNEYKIDNKEMKAYIEEYKDHLLQNHYICVKDNYFVSLIITAGERFKEELKLRKGKPYYIPEKEELLKYEDPFYFEITPEYIELRDYLRKLYWRRSKADEITNEVRSYCSSTYSFINLIDVLVNIKVKNDDQFEDIKLLSMQLYKNTRLGEYNGSTYLEVYT